MICPNCQTEQYNHKFCNRCGQNLHKLREEEKSIEHESTNLAEKEEKVKKKKQFQMKWNIDNPTLVKGISFPLGSLVFLVLLAAILAKLLNGSRMIKDYIFLFFTETLQLGEQVAISLLSTMKLTLFDLLLAMHGGTMKGTIWEGSGSPIFQFTFQFPVILAILVTIVIVALAFYLLKRYITVSPVQKLAIIGISAVVYSVIVIIILHIVKPAYSIHDTAFQVSFSAFSIFINSILIFCIAGLIGFGPWKAANSEKGQWLTVLQPLKTFFLTLLLLEVFICILMVSAWLLTNPATLMAQPMVSPGSMWFIYRNDPFFYMLLPNIVLTEQLYAIGGTWQITSPLLSELIQVSNPFSINILTGSNTIGIENVAAWTSNVDSARFVWHPFALLIAFIYALLKLPQNVSLATKIYQGLGVVAVITLLSNWLTISFRSQNANGIVGFNVIQVLVSGAIVIGIVYAAQFYLPKVFSKKRLGEET